MILELKLATMIPLAELLRHTLSLRDAIAYNDPKNPEPRFLKSLEEYIRELKGTNKPSKAFKNNDNIDSAATIELPVSKGAKPQYSNTYN